ncbi:MAG TPA: zinc ribbon domain-containing protein [Candidatus Dormibacteraeota bacterium]|jgi:RNA polymerase subunit RPABC4/transcription elongation factor Spt4|nr:zinc ribbon domain-containing protein [Candidatus Dormibacteraeota bacterium]
MTPAPAALLDSGAGAFLAIVVVLFLAFFWIALAYWAYRDARRRSDSVWLAVFALAVNVLPYLGLLLYVVLRPPRTMDEERALLLEEQALTEGPAEVISRPCPTCGREIELDFVICPYCRTQFARRCRACQRWLRLGWRVCPYCAEEVAAQGRGGTGQAASS